MRVCSVLSSSLRSHGLLLCSWILSGKKILEWLATSSSGRSSQSRDETHVSCVSCIGRQILYHWATWEAIKFIVLALSHFSHVRLFVTLWTVTRESSLSMGFSRQEYRNRLPWPPPGMITQLKNYVSFPLNSALEHLAVVLKPTPYTHFLIYQGAPFISYVHLQSDRIKVAYFQVSDFHEAQYNGKSCLPFL